MTSMQKKKRGGGLWIKIIFVPVYILILGVFAVQTYQLVSTLFPADNWFMQAVTVFSFDICSIFYAMAEMMYPFQNKNSKHIIFGMWLVTFVLSLAASMIQMYVTSVSVLPHTINPNIIAVAYGLVILAFAANIIAMTCVLRMEWNAAHPEEDEPTLPQPPQRHVVDTSMEEDWLAFRQWRTSGSIPAIGGPTSAPLAQPLLTQQNHNSNGKAQP